MLKSWVTSSVGPEDSMIFLIAANMSPRGASASGPLNPSRLCQGWGVCSSSDPFSGLLLAPRATGLSWGLLDMPRISACSS